MQSGLGCASAYLQRTACTVGKRSRRRAAAGSCEASASTSFAAEALAGLDDLTGTERMAASADYTDAHGNVLTLRTSFTPGARREYAETLSGARAGASATQEDTWRRATELLFERLAIRWTIAGAPLERPRELLMRYRAASAQERSWIRDVLRAHCREHFPDVSPP